MYADAHDNRPPNPRPRMRAQNPGTDSFRNDQLLQPFILTGVSPTGKTLGVGSYGSVLEVCRTDVLSIAWFVEYVSFINLSVYNDTMYMSFW